MGEINLNRLKDLGLQREVVEALPYAVVGGTWDGTYITDAINSIVMNHIVPAGHQLKILFLRVWTQEPTGQKFSIVQTNTGYTVVGSVPSGVRDYPMLEAAGCEVLHGNLETPVHVLEGSIDFIIRFPRASPYRTGIVWWGVEKIPEE
jgi:hypothetical protein